MSLKFLVVQDVILRKPRNLFVLRLIEMVSIYVWILFLYMNGFYICILKCLFWQIQCSILKESFVLNTAGLLLLKRITLWKNAKLLQKFIKVRYLLNSVECNAVSRTLSGISGRPFPKSVDSFKLHLRYLTGYWIFQTIKSGFGICPCDYLVKPRIDYWFFINRNMAK